MVCSVVLAALLAVFAISSSINETSSLILSNQNIYNLLAGPNVLRRLEKREVELEDTGNSTIPPTADGGSEGPSDPSDIGTVRNRTRKGHGRWRGGERRGHHSSYGKGCHGKRERNTTTEKPNESPKDDIKKLYNTGDGVHLYFADDDLALDSYHGENQERRERRRGFESQGREKAGERREELPVKDE